ncbi:protein C19orf12 homolog isoform X2 [Athalia rosae]|nr:protein C19orf12 homolog isoform X2 [Athalia rosae]XP_012263830.1 protein C19orf12 homolog isoform X2 [Athalia rosae]XP_020710662.1 protein C19orf12 homolog isoform X2 [Athalia rosae]
MERQERRNLLLAVSKLTELETVRVSIKESFKGAAIAGVTTLVGGLFLGPIGLAIGGAAGGCTAAYMAKDKFRSVPDIIIHDLTPQQQKELEKIVLETIRSFPIQDVAYHAVNLANDPALATTVAMAVISYLNSLPGMHIID